MTRKHLAVKQKKVQQVPQNQVRNEAEKKRSREEKAASVVLILEQNLFFLFLSFFFPQLKSARLVCGTAPHHCSL